MAVGSFSSRYPCPTNHSPISISTIAPARDDYFKIPVQYHVAETQNLAQVALEAGNSPQMIFKHYRELVRPADAKTRFALAPGGEEKVIVSRKPDGDGQKALSGQESEVRSPESEECAKAA